MNTIFSQEHETGTHTEEIYMQMVDGYAYPLLHPCRHDIRWNNFVWALARIPRFNGHTKTPAAHYSVAQHLCLCHDVATQSKIDLDDFPLAVLLHDFHEAIVGDVVSPVKAAFKVLGCDGPFRSMVSKHDEAIYSAAGLVWPLSTELRDAIRVVDLQLLATERRDLMEWADTQDLWLPLPDPIPLRIIPWAVETAFVELKWRLDNCFAGIK